MIAALLCAWALATEPPEPADPFEPALDLMRSVSDSGYPRGGTLLAVVALEEHPDHPRAPLVRLEVSRHQRVHGLLFEEEQTLARGLEIHPSRWKPWFELALLDARLQRQDFGAVAASHEDRAEWPPQIADAAHYYGAWGRAGTGDEEGARVLLAKVRGDLQPAAQDFAAALVAVPPKRRNPAVAGALSVIPGAGHVYVADPAGAAANVLVTGGLATTGVYFYTQDEPVLATVFGILGTASLFAGVGDAMRQAQAYNRAHRIERFEALANRWWIRGRVTDDATEPLRVDLSPPVDPEE